MADFTFIASLQLDDTRVFKNLPLARRSDKLVLIWSYLCFCFNFVPQILTQFKSRFAVICPFTALGKMILWAEIDIQ